MAEWGGAVEVDGLPSSASIDELSVLLSQLAHCRQHHILLSSRGTASAVAALVLLPSLSEASSVAELLDSYPLSGGLLETQLCADSASWAQTHVLQVGGCCLSAAHIVLPTQQCLFWLCYGQLAALSALMRVCPSFSQHLPKAGSGRQQSSVVPASLPPQQTLQPPRPQPLQPLPPAPQPLPPAPQPLPSGSGGLAALEAEAREVQRMRQEQQQLFSGGGSGGGWGDEEEEEGNASDSEGGWSHVGGRSGSARSLVGGRAAPKHGSSDAASRCRIIVRNIVQASQYTLAGEVP